MMFDFDFFDIRFEVDFSDLIDFSNLNVRRLFLQESAGDGKDPFQTHNGIFVSCVLVNDSTIKFFHCFTVTLLHCYTVTLVHWYTGTLVHCLTV